MKPSWIVRPYRKQDHAHVCALHEHALMAAGARAGIGPWDEDLERIEEEYFSTGGCFLVVEQEGEIVGMGALKVHGSGQTEIKRMRVAPSHQRQGLGQLIMNALLDHAQRVGAGRIFLHTSDRQVAACRLYEKAGFVEFSRKPWRGLTMIYYQKILAPAAPSRARAQNHV